MTNTLCGSKFRVFFMPDRVDEDVLTSALRELLSSATPTSWVLDFSATVHIHYRALSRFASRLRQAKSLSRPIVLAGLNPYCEEIARFALLAEDWEIFAQGESHDASVPPGGIGGNEGQQLEQRQLWIAWQEVRSLFFPPCPN